MAPDIESQTPPVSRRQKVQALFYMDQAVITELKHRAVDQKKSYSQLAEELIAAGLRDNTSRPE